MKRILVDEHEVAREREVGAGTDRDTVDGGDGRFVELPELPDEGLDAGAQRLRGGPRREPGFAGLRDRRRAEIHPGAERVTGSGDQHRGTVGSARKRAPRR